MACASRRALREHRWTACARAGWSSGSPPPVDGAANEAVVKALAAALDLPRSAVLIVGGDASRNKIVEVVGDGAFTQHEFGGNLTIGVASGDQTHHLDLTVGQAVGASGWVSPDS